MFSRFFVRRPVFAWVIAILIMLAGMLAIRTLPVAQYPDVAPPSLQSWSSWSSRSCRASFRRLALLDQASRFPAHALNFQCVTRCLPAL